MKTLVATMIIGIGTFFGIQTVQALHPPTEHVLADGDSLLNAVTQTISLPAEYVPGDLTVLSVVGEPNEQARNVIVSDLQNMMNAAQRDGVPLDIISSFRNFEQQRRVHNYWHNVSSQADTFSAHAGHSEHQLGTAIDFSNGKPRHNFSESFANTGQYKWLQENAWKYGFALTYPRNGFEVTGIVFEPWQWRYIGRNAATEWHDSSLILEEFLLTKPQRFQSEGALLRVKGDTKVYRVASNTTRRWLMTAHVFESYGFNWKMIEEISRQDLEEIPRTRAIRLGNNPGVYLLTENHRKRGVGSLQTLQARGITLQDVVSVNETEFNAYPSGTFIP